MSQDTSRTTWASGHRYYLSRDLRFSIVLAARRVSGSKEPQAGCLAEDD